MDGNNYNEVISTPWWWCLLLSQILTSGEAFQQEGSWGEGGGGGGIQYVRGNYINKWDKSDGCRNNASVYTPAWYCLV